VTVVESYGYVQNASADATLLIELNDIVDKLLDATTCQKISPFHSSQSDPLLANIPHTICHTTAIPLPNESLLQTQIPLWPLCHAAPCHKLAPGSKF